MAKETTRQTLPTMMANWDHHDHNKTIKNTPTKPAHTSRKSPQGSLPSRHVSPQAGRLPVLQSDGTPIRSPSYTPESPGGSSVFLRTPHYNLLTPPPNTLPPFIVLHLPSTHPNFASHADNGASPEIPTRRGGPKDQAYCDRLYALKAGHPSLKGNDTLGKKHQPPNSQKQQ